MFILKNNIAIRFIYIVLLLLILLQYLRYIYQPIIYPHLSHISPQSNPNLAVGRILDDYLMGERQSDQNISFSFVLKDHTKNCYYRWRNYEFTINSCNKWQIGSILTIIGSHDYVSASAIFEQISLNIQSIEPVSMGAHSAYGSIPTFVAQIQRIVWFAFDIKAFLLQENTKLHSLQTEQLVRAMVFGDKSLIDPKVYHYFEITGTLYVLAVSGMHVGLLHILLTHLTSRFWPSLRFFSQVVLLILYAIIVGFGPSVARATAMLLLALITVHILKRQKQSWHVLFLVVIGLLLFNDWYLFMVGFQLSVLATASIIGLQMYRRQFRSSTFSSDSSLYEGSRENTWSVLFASVQTNAAGQSGLPKNSRGNSATNTNLVRSFLQHILTYVKEICILSGFIQLMLAPLLWIHFGQLSWVGIIAAPVLMWLVPPVFLFATISFSIVLFSSAMNFIGASFIAHVLEIFRVISSVFLELSVHTFLFLLGFIANFFESVAFIEVRDFSVFAIFIWYSVLFTGLFLFSWLNRRKKLYV